MTCTNCGAELPEEARFCLSCGAPQGTSLVPASAEERKVVSVLFCDVVGFTSRSEAADPEDVRAAMRPYYARLRTEIERHGGTVEKFIGDAVMAVFGAPIAHEDDAERAVRSGLAILDGIEDLNAEEDLDLSVRIGINTGETVVALGAKVDEGEGIVTGDVVNTAARLQTAAPIGAAVVGEATHHATDRVFDYVALEPVVAKGKSEPVTCWQVLKARARVGEVLSRTSSTPFVGRRDDLALLQNLFSRSIRDRSVQLVTIVGEPGVGKSRLVGEFSRFVADLPDLVIWRVGRCLSYGEGITFWALGEIIKSQAGILETDDADSARAKLEQAIPSDEPDRDWMLARVGILVGLDAPAAEREESFTAWRHFLERVASDGPSVFVIEDIHWADDAMLAFWEHLASWSQDLPITVVATSRPELFERYPSWGGGLRNATTIALGPLGEAETAELVAALVSQQMAVSTVDQITARCGGNPLFAEEFARMLSERAADDADAYPDTVQSLIAARIDTLKPDRKSLLQDAAVIGHVFWSGALASVGDRDPSEVREVLHELTRKELIRTVRTSSMEGESEFAFWHALVADVAYAQIPRAARADKHVAVADWIESSSGARQADVAELVAEHYLEALHLKSLIGTVEAPLADAARPRLVLAAERVGERDPSRRGRYLRAALDLAPPPEERLDLLVSLASDLVDTEGRWRDAAEALREAAVIAEGTGKVTAHGMVLRKLGSVLVDGGDGEGARRCLQASVDLLRAVPQSEEFFQSLCAMAFDHIARAELEEATRWMAEADALASRLGPRAVLDARVYQTMIDCDTGQARDVSALSEVCTRSRDEGSTIHMLVEMQNYGEALWMTQGPLFALPVLEEAVELGEGRGFNAGVVGKEQMLGPLFDIGRPEELLTHAEDVLAWSSDEADGYHDLRVRPWMMLARAVLGERAPAEEVERLVTDSSRLGQAQVIVPALTAAAMNTDGAIALAYARTFHEYSQDRPSWQRSVALPEIVRVALEQGDAELASALVSGTVPMYERGILAVDTGMALLAGYEGNSDAVGLFASLTERWAEYGHVRETELARAAADNR